MKNFIYAITTAILISILTACGGSSGGGGSVAPSYTVDYTADATPSGGAVTLQRNNISGSIVYIDVVANGVTDLFGADIRILIDDTKVALGGACTAGSLLDGAIAYCTQSGGIIELGVSLQAPADAISGSGVIATLPVKVIAAGESVISFSSDSVLTDSVAPMPNTVLSYSISEWLGGSISGM